MRAIVLLFSLILASCGEIFEPIPVPAEPKYSTLEDAPKIVSTFRSHVTFGLSGLAFLGTKLYVTSNIGLFEVQSGQPKFLYRWRDDHNVIRGPWQDKANGAVWLQRLEDMKFVRISASGWVREGLPSGSFTRGDFLRGFKIVSTNGEPRLVGAGEVWKWESEGIWWRWRRQSEPPRPSDTATVAYAKLLDGEIQVRTNDCFTEPCAYTAYRLRGDKWEKPIRLPFKSVSGIQNAVVVSDELFLLGDGDRLVQVKDDGVREFSTPGPTEAIAITSKGKLLASFRGMGVYEFDNGWKQRVSSPYGPEEGEHFAYLAEENGSIAFATSQMPQLRSASRNEWEYTGTTALWISKSDKFTRVRLMPNR